MLRGADGSALLLLTPGFLRLPSTAFPAAIRSALKLGDAVEQVIAAAGCSHRWSPHLCGRHVPSPSRRSEDYELEIGHSGELGKHGVECDSL
jgi:hypothetical protein